ncbi:MAG: hypothetical protein ACQEQF_00170 [Bacillota bacterium]
MTNDFLDLKEGMIKEKLDEAIIENNKIQYDKKQRGGIHASSIIMPEGSFCLREQVINYFVEKDEFMPLPPKTINRLENGNYLHEKWQDIFKNNGIADRIEKQHGNRFGTTGTPDIIANMWGKRYIVEIKTSKGEKFNSMTKLPIATKRQIQFYMYLTGIPRGFVIYENINTADYEIYFQEYEPDFVKKYIERESKIWEGINKFNKNGILPPQHDRCISRNAGRANTCNCTEYCFNKNKLGELNK